MAERPGGVGRRIADVAFAAAVVLSFLLAARGLFRKITWYLAIDQYGYLTFAGDLAAGRIFHRWPPLEALADLIPYPRVDVLSQTYVFAGDRMYCRYSPGFPLLLAGWIRIFGVDAAHYLDPILFLALLAVCLELGRRLFAAVPGARWLGLAGVLLLLLLPSYLHLWAITILRDIPAQLFAFTALLVALPRSRLLSWRRAAIVGLLAGYLVAIRIDALLYGLPIGTLLLIQPRRRGALAVAGALAVLGVTPLLVYNQLSTGHALRPTQGMEVDRFFDGKGLSHNRPEAPSDVQVASAPPAPARRRGPRAGVPPAVQGGGLRLGNLRRTLPGNATYVREATGPVLLTLAGLGIVIGVFTTELRRVVILGVPYSVAALLFFSFWGRADPRYIAGVLLFGPFLAVAGFAGLSAVAGFAGLSWPPRLLSAGGNTDDASGRSSAPEARPPAARPGRWLRPVVVGITVLALAVGWREVFGEAWADAQDAWETGGWPGSSLSVVGGGVGALVLLVAATGAAAPRRMPPHWPAAALAALLLTVAVVRAIPGWSRPPVLFQGSRGKSDVERARRTIEAVIEPGAIVITTMDVGRPAENIDHYTNGYAVYMTDLERWGFTVALASARFMVTGHAVYLLLPSTSPQGEEALADLRASGHDVRHLVHVEPADALRYFVASRFGAPALDLYRVTLPRDVLERVPGAAAREQE